MQAKGTPRAARVGPVRDPVLVTNVAEGLADILGLVETVRPPSVTPVVPLDRPGRLALPPDTPGASAATVVGQPSPRVVTVGPALGPRHVQVPPARVGHGTHVPPNAAGRPA